MVDYESECDRRTQLKETNMVGIRLKMLKEASGVKVIDRDGSNENSYKCINRMRLV